MSLSLPATTSKEIKTLSKKRGFKSVSSYIQSLVELDKDLISEETLWHAVQEGRAEYKSGKTVKAKSLGDLV